MKINLTALNLVLFFGGLAIMLIGLYRISPLKLEGKMLEIFLIQNVPLLIFLIISIVWLFMIGGSAYEKEGFKKTFAVTAGWAPMMLLLFPVMAFGGLLVKHYDVVIEQVLTGVYGYPGTLLAAFLVPTSNSASDAVMLFWKNAELRPLILYFLTTVALVCWPVFFIRTLGLTPEIGWEMYKVNWIVAVGIMPMFWLWSRAVKYGGLELAFVSIFWFP